MDFQILLLLFSLLKVITAPLFISEPVAGRVKMVPSGRADLIASPEPIPFAKY